MSDNKVPELLLKAFQRIVKETEASKYQVTQRSDDWRATDLFLFFDDKTSVHILYDGLYAIDESYTNEIIYGINTIKEQQA